MGCGNSIESQIPQEWYEQFASLKMTKSDMSALLKVYKKVDLDGSGSVDLLELFVFLEVEHTPFTERVFKVFDSNGTGKIDFREFVLALWNYCTLSKATLDIFTFDLYDADASGVLSDDEVITMLTDIYGRKMKKNHNAQGVLQELHKVEAKGAFTIERFTKFVRTHQEMLFPAFQLQLHLQEKVCGRSFWKRCSNRRVELSSGKFVTMGDLMQLHVRKDLYDKFVRDGSFYGRRVQSKAKLILENTGTVQHRNHGEFHHIDDINQQETNESQHRGSNHNKHLDVDGHPRSSGKGSVHSQDRPSGRRQPGHGHGQGHGHGVAVDG